MLLNKKNRRQPVFSGDKCFVWRKMVKKNTYLVTYLHLLIRRQNKPEIWRIAVGLLRCQCQHCNSAPHKTLNTKLPDVDGSDEVTVGLRRVR